MISTKNVKSNNLGPVLSPGNHKVKINSIVLEQTPYDKESFNLNLNVESEPIGGEFQGFLVDPNNQNGPRYKGQVARVRMSPYAYKDTVLPSGRKISKDDEIVRALAFVADVMGKRKEVDMVEASTIEEFVKSCNTILSGPTYINACIGGREWQNKEGYTNVDLSLPRISKEGVPLEALDVESSRLFTFDYDKFVKRLKQTNQSVSSNDDTVDFESTYPSSEEFDL